MPKRLADFTADREFHPTLKIEIFIFYIQQYRENAIICQDECEKIFKYAGGTAFVIQMPLAER